MEGIRGEIYSYISNLTHLGKNKYEYLISLYGADLVDSVIEMMIDLDEKNLSKFNYYVSMKTYELDKITDVSILDLYMLDISNTKRLSDDENQEYARCIYQIVERLNALLSLISVDTVRKSDSLFVSVLDRAQYYLKHCDNVTIKDEIKELSSKFINIRNKLVEGNLRLVIALAKPYYRNDVLFSEIVQYGNVGLMRACEKYNPNQGSSFVTYAYYWIKQSIRRGQKKETYSPMSISYDLFEKNSLRLKGLDDLTKLLGREPTKKELSSYMGVSIARLQEVETAFMVPVSLYEKSSGGTDDVNDMLVMEYIMDRQVHIERDVCSCQLRPEIIRAMKDYLDDKLYFVLEKRFGLDGKELTLVEIGNMLGVTKEYVRKQEVKALRRLKSLASKRLVDFLE